MEVILPPLYLNVLKNRLFNFNEFPIIHTERLWLRELISEDAKAVFELRSNPEVKKYIQRNGPHSIEEGKNFIDRVRCDFELSKCVQWAICLEGSEVIIGSICLWNISLEASTAELGYELFPKFQRNGFMSEAAAVVTQFGFSSLGLKRQEAYTHFKNKSSIRMLTNLGFVLDPSRKDQDNPNNAVYTKSTTPDYC